MQSQIAYKRPVSQEFFPANTKMRPLKKKAQEHLRTCSCISQPGIFLRKDHHDLAALKFFMFRKSIESVYPAGIMRNVNAFKVQKTLGQPAYAVVEDRPSNFGHLLEKLIHPRF